MTVEASIFKLGSGYPTFEPLELSVTFTLDMHIHVGTCTDHHPSKNLTNRQINRDLVDNIAISHSRFMFQNILIS